MRAYDIIVKKRNGYLLSDEEIQALIVGYMNGEVADAQMAAWLMAVYFRGMSPEETTALTMAMVNSGMVLDLSAIPGIKVDKHSTGGVGDKTTLVLLPLLAAAGVPVAKMSGRSLGHTGGTIDKLESIPGFCTELTQEQMIEQVKRIGLAISAQTANLAPADKKLYALRDLTGTVDCAPLISASVMSKKIASGADVIVLDVKAGLGAFMKSVSEAQELARIMVEIGSRVGRKTAAVVTAMNQPLGRTVGNALEIKEAIETLKGKGPHDLVTLSAVLGGLALFMAGKAETSESGEEMVRELIANGQGLGKLRELIEAQGGNPEVVEDYSLFPKAAFVETIESPESGYITVLDAYQVALATVELGVSRGVPGAEPDFSVGVRLFHKVGDWVPKGDVLAELHAKDSETFHTASELLLTAYSFSPNPPPPSDIIHAIVS